MKNVTNPSLIDSTEESRAAVATSNQPVIPLTPDEEQQLAKLEKVVDAKLEHFFAVGNAILEIKSKELYRGTHKNFHDYCQIRWGFGRSYANKLLGSAERIRLLPEGTQKPSNEFQIRPFLQLDPLEFPKKWQAVLDSVDKGKVTSTIVIDILNLPKRKQKKRKTNKSVNKSEFKDLVAIIRTALEQGKIDVAKEHLAKLEKLLKD